MKNIRDIIDIKSFQKMQDDIANATESSIVTVDCNGVPITKHSRCSEYCNLMRSKEKFSKKCEQCDSRGGLESAKTGKFYVYECHRGLTDVAVPIIVEEEYLGAVMFGGVILEGEKEKNLEKAIGKDLSEEEIEEVKKAYFKLPTNNYKTIKSIAEMIGHVSKHIVREAILKETQKEIYNKNIEIALAEKEKIKLEKEYKSCKLKALQAQINPHFLFNVLNSISSLAIIEDAPKTEAVIYNLSSILRYTLKKADKTVRLEEEVDYIKSYLEIQKVRFGERLVYNLEIEEELKEIKIPFLSLQVFIENAVIHGIEESEKGGYVNLSIKSKEDKIIIIIKDNGIGIDKEKLKKIREEINDKDKLGLDKIGINNVNKRMDYYFKDNYNIEIYSRVNEGTKVKITIPKNIL